ncbi:MAG: signal peptide peptidase SppA, partial [Bacteroidota bacterium]
TSLWNSMLEAIAESRNISVDELNTYAENLSISDAASVKKYNFVDDLKYKDEVLAIMNDKMDEDPTDKIDFLSMGKYRMSPVKVPKKDIVDNEVAVIFAEGNIVNGTGDDNSIGGERFAKAIRKARLDDDIKAIVLRINSPGGSGLASEIIWREISLAKEEKPVVASMGNFAASGGYYIACAADHIYAHPTTLTGSIGVFGLMFTAEELLNEKLGINVEVVNTNEHADMGNIARSFDQRETDYMQNMVENFYDVFITRVADGRDMTKEEVDEIGQGRVWTGRNAIDIGLVDEFGGLEEAVVKAAELADIEKYEIGEYPRMKDFMEQIFSEFTITADVDMLENLTGMELQSLRRLKSFTELDEGVQARMPVDITFE